MHCIADVGATLGEGPAWDPRDQALYWVDLDGQALFRWHPTGITRVELDRPLCSIVPRASGGFVGAGHDGFVFIDQALAITPLHDPERHLPHNRFNDGKLDRAGRFWAGTMAKRERGANGSLYRLDADLHCTAIDTGYTITNGPAFSLDGRVMYHTDTAHQRIYAFDLAIDGRATNRRVFAEFAGGQGYPDGMTIDADDCLWVAFWAGWCLRRLSPTGAILAEIAVPVQQPTSCTFGGDALDQLFITSAARGLDAAALARQPQAGGTFVTRVGVGGVAEIPFAG